MLQHDVPEWYIWSCERIKYMFPKAHAAAYVMMAYRIAYCKINYPLAYYAAYFGIRASAFSYELMGQGKEKLLYHMKEYKRRAELNQLSKKDQDTLKDMKNVLEMYGISIEQLDGGIISSVVPPVTNIVKRSVEKILNTEVMLIGPGVKTGLNILMDDPRQVGSDRIVNAVAVVHEYSGDADRSRYTDCPHGAASKDQSGTACKADWKKYG